MVLYFFGCWQLTVISGVSGLASGAIICASKFCRIILPGLIDDDIPASLSWSSMASHSPHLEYKFSFSFIDRLMDPFFAFLSIWKAHAAILCSGLFIPSMLGNVTFFGYADIVCMASTFQPDHSLRAGIIPYVTVALNTPSNASRMAFWPGLDIPVLMVLSSTLTAERSSLVPGLFVHRFIVRQFNTGSHLERIQSPETGRFAFDKHQGIG